MGKNFIDFIYNNPDAGNIKKSVMIIKKKVVNDDTESLETHIQRKFVDDNLYNHVRNNE